jgi:RNA polymerase sigma-70 factor (ECF subfamily)
MQPWHDDGALPTAGAADAPLPFEALYERYFGFTWRALRHLGVPVPWLEDAAQEVWIIVHRRLPGFEARSSTRTWLFGIALNVARNRRRGLRRAPAMQPLPEQLVCASPDPEDQHAGSEMWRTLESFLDTLDDQRRAVFVSSLIEQLPAAETAAATGVEVAQVYHQVRRLREAFREYLASRQGEKR